jgi:hypothetical protein
VSACENSIRLKEACPAKTVRALLWQQTRRRPRFSTGARSAEVENSSYTYKPSVWSGNLLLKMNASIQAASGGVTGYPFQDEAWLV